MAAVLVRVSAGYDRESLFPAIGLIFVNCAGWLNTVAYLWNRRSLRALSKYSATTIITGVPDPRASSVA